MNLTCRLPICSCLSYSKITLISIYHVGRDSSVGLATGYRLDGPVLGTL